MSRQENLELTVRRTADGYRFRPPVRITGDPDDLAELADHLDRIVRDRTGRRDSVGYELIVRHGRGREFVVHGRKR